MDWQIGGNAFGAFASAARNGKKRLMAAVTRGAHEVQARAKINVKRKLNTTGESKGTLSRSITVLARPQRLEAAIGPSVIYGRIHELGGIIKPVKARALFFTVPNAYDVKSKKATSSALVMVQQVEIPARPYLQPALDDAQPQLRAIFEEEIRGLLGGPS